MTLTRRIVRLFTRTHVVTVVVGSIVHTYLLSLCKHPSMHKSNIAIGVSKHPSTHKTNVAIEVSEVLLHLSGSDLM